MWFDFLPKEHVQSLSIEFQEKNYPLTERLDPSHFHAIRSSRRNERHQPKPQKTYHKVVREEGDPAQDQQSIPSPAGRAYVSPPSDPTMGDHFSPGLETTALLRAGENGDIGPNCGEGKHSADGESEVTNEFGPSSWDAGVEKDFQLFERHDTTTGLGQAGLGSVTEDAKGFAGLQDYMNKEQRKSCCDILSAPVPGRRKFIVPKLPDFSKLLERYT